MSFSRTLLFFLISAIPWCSGYAIDTQLTSKTIFSYKGSTEGSNAVAKISGTGYLEPASENFSYDLDGNRTEDGRWNYSWDYKNRLIRIESKLEDLVIENVFDSRDRRVQKMVVRDQAVERVVTFLYDDWNPQKEVHGNAQGAIQKTCTYTWGKDLSGRLRTAGGVGGLLQIEVEEGGEVSTLLPLYDGHGDVVALFDKGLRQITGEYQYGPFGETVSLSGSAATTCAFRFSTKYTDIETGLVYYGYRFYDPRTGSWMSRDPQGEAGGLNLYGFVDNNPVNQWDYLGLVSYGGYEPTTMVGKGLSRDHFKIFRDERGTIRVAFAEYIEWHNTRTGYSKEFTGKIRISGGIRKGESINYQGFENLYQSAVADYESDRDQAQYENLEMLLSFVPGALAGEQWAEGHFWKGTGMLAVEVAFWYAGPILKGGGQAVRGAYRGVRSGSALRGMGQGFRIAGTALKNVGKEGLALKAAANAIHRQMMREGMMGSFTLPPKVVAYAMAAGQRLRPACFPAGTLVHTKHGRLESSKKSRP